MPTSNALLTASTAAALQSNDRLALRESGNFPSSSENITNTAHSLALSRNTSSEYTGTMNDKYPLGDRKYISFMDIFKGKSDSRSAINDIPTSTRDDLPISANASCPS